MSLQETLPSDWHFFAKGNANALFQYKGNNPSFKDRLLRQRLQKDPQLYVSVSSLKKFIQQTCEPLFPGQLVGTEIIEVTSDFRNNLNTQGCILMQTEQYGFLMTNVRQGTYERYKLLKYCSFFVENKQRDDQTVEVNSVLFEFKPKWVYDPESSYCRTCLLKQLKGHKRHFCCLDLVREERFEKGVNDLVSEIPESVQKSLSDSLFPLVPLLMAFVHHPNNVLQKLKKYEQVDEKDQILSLDSPDDVLENLSLVMTLRDVGLFLKISKVKVSPPKLNGELLDGDTFFVKENHSTYEISSYIYDLDLKSSSRYEHWKSVEEQLQPYYNGKSLWPICR